MLNEIVFREKWTSLAYLPVRDGSDPEEAGRFRTYYRALLNANLVETDLIEACDRILCEDHWFPTIARIIDVTDICAKERRIRQSAAQPAVRHGAPLVCGRCHGARFLRMGGYSPSIRPDILPVGSAGSRTLPCPDCTVNGRYDVAAEARAIARSGGVPDPNAAYMPDMDAVTWPARMAELRDPETGRIDGECVYRLSRELRGLDPDVDDRPRGVGSWRSMREVVRHPAATRGAAD